MRSFLAWLDRVATPRWLLLLAVLELVLLVSENALDFPLSVPFMRRVSGHPYLDLCAFCSAAEISGQLDDFGEAGRRLQLMLMPTIDVAIPVLSFAFGRVALSLLLRGRAQAWAFAIRSLPLAALALDLAENAAIIALVTAYPRRLASLATLLGLLSGLKFVACLATGIAVAGLGLWRRPRPRSPEADDAGPRS